MEGYNLFWRQREEIIVQEDSVVADKNNNHYVLTIPFYYLWHYKFYIYFSLDFIFLIPWQVNSW